MEQLTLNCFVTPSEPIKRCNRCKELKPSSEFGKYSRSPDGKRPECKICHGNDSKKRYANNKEVISEQNKEYRKQNRDKIIERKRKYYQKNRGTILQKEHESYQLNKDKHQQWFQRYYAENRENLIEYQKKYRADNPDKKCLQNKEYREKNIEKICEYQKAYHKNNKEKLIKYQRDYYVNNRERLIKKYSDYLKTPAGKVHQAKMKAKRKKLGFNPINKYFKGSHYHHLRYDANGNKDNNIGIFIPKEIHQSLYHNGQTGQGMEEMNKLAIEWYLSTCDSNSEELLKLGLNGVKEFVERYHSSI